MRKFKDDSDGVAAVVGTVLGLAVFLAFISIFTLYWVPVMMKDNETTHMREVISQFSDLKKTIEDQISLNNRNETKYSPIDLGADAVPLFERETPSQLSLRPLEASFNFTFQDSGENIYENASGSVDLRAYNRFYVPQTVIYENGAVLIYQKKGSLVKMEPDFNVEVGGGNVTLSTTLVTLYHETEDSVSGIGTESIGTRLWYVDRWIYTNITSGSRSVNLTVNSRYSEAWLNYYDTILSNAGLSEGVDYNITQTSGSFQITIDNVSEFTLGHAFVYAHIGREAK